MTATNLELRTPDAAGTPSATVPSAGPLRRLSRAECTAWIVGHDEARLGFDTGRGHRSVVVGYAVEADGVFLELPEYHPATGYVLGSPVTLEVEDALAGGSWESVRASGVAALVDPRRAGSVHPYGAGWPPGIATHTVRVPLAELEGVVRAA